ncbi:MAG: polyprenyl synthetase family protein [Acidobacteriota bacterium]
MEKFLEYLEEKRKKIDNSIENILPPPEIYPSSLHQAMRYGVLNGGKRIRPILTIAVSEITGGKEEPAMIAGTSIELIHCASLILDDLPCMDNSVLRRGKETCHRVFGEDIAILAAFGLLNMGYYLLATLKEKGVKDKIVVNLMKRFNDAIGTDGLLAGQTVDLESNSKNITSEIIDYIYNKKTASLFVAAAEFGSILSEINKKEMFSILRYARDIGLAFQIKDDILDAEGDIKKLGKEIKKDLKKTTHVSLFGVEKSKEKVKELINSAINHINQFGKKAELLINLAKFIEIRET